MLKTSSPVSSAVSGGHRRLLLRILAFVFSLGVLSVVLVAGWYYGRRTLLTSEWSPLLGERGTEVTLEGAVEAASLPLVQLPAEAILFRVDGESPGDYFGWAVEGLGDVNGDGVPDFAVGAHQHINQGVRGNKQAPAGYVRVFSGADSSEIYTVRPEGSLKIDGGDDTFGWTLTALGDVDSDGTSDFAVGAFLFDYEDSDSGEIDENTGAVLIFSGATGQRLALLGGERWGDRFGFHIDAIPDQDGDGLPDLLVGVEKGETTSNVENAGRVEIFSSVTHERLALSSGPAWEARMGHSVAALDDIDGDGFADYASGAYMHGAMEEAEIERGAAGAMSGRTGELLFGWEGAAQFDYLGHSLTDVGDVDGDGIGDIALGAIQSGVEAELSGVYSGPGYVRIHSCADGRLLGMLVGEKLGDQFGWALSNIGDRNGDGIDELIVGAPASITFLEKKLDRVGRVYVFSGKDRKLLKAIGGLEQNDQFGASVAPIGDLDGDGLSEILIGAPQNVEGQTESGYAVVVSGKFFE